MSAPGLIALLQEQPVGHGGREKAASAPREHDFRLAGQLNKPAETLFTQFLNGSDTHLGALPGCAHAIAPDGGNNDGSAHRREASVAQ